MTSKVELSSASLELDADGAIAGASAAAQALLARPEHELIGRPAESLFRLRERGEIGAALHSAGPLITETAIGHGQRRERAVCLVVDERPATGRRRMLLRPLDETCPLLSRVERAERRYQNLLDDLHVGVVVQGPASEMLLWNRKALDLLGLTEAQLTGRTSFDPHWNVIHEDGSDFPGSTHPVTVALRTARSVRGVVMGVFRPARADRVWLLVDAEPRFDGNGEVEHVVCTFSDITERRRLTEKFARAQKFELVSRLAGGLAHDFSNLLSVILTVAEMYQIDVARDGLASLDPKLLAEDFGEVIAAVRQGTQLTRRLLTLAGRHVEQVGQVPVDPSIRAMRNLIRRAIGDRVELILELGAPGVSLRVDSSRFEQALLNLAINARDAMPEGGTLTMRSQRTGETVRIEVSDTGTGIPVEVAAQVFEPFFTTKPSGQGTGLGLPSVRDFAEQAGGEVSFQSSRAGTTFLFELPCEEGEAPQNARTLPASRPARGAGQRVLVVDNDPGIRRVLAECLRREGYVVMMALSAEHALRVLREDPIQLLVTDVVMPGTDGVSLVQQARAEQAALPVLYVSGYLGSRQEDLALDGQTRLLAKPFALDDLLEVVSALLG